MLKSLTAIVYFPQKILILEPKEKREILFFYYLSLVRTPVYFIKFYLETISSANLGRRNVIFNKAKSSWDP